MQNSGRNPQVWLLVRLLFSILLLGGVVGTVGAQVSSESYEEIEAAFWRALETTFLLDDEASSGQFQFSGLPDSAFGHELQHAAAAPLSAIPAGAMQAIQDAPYDRDVYTVHGLSEWDYPILKVRELVFSPLATLQLNDLSGDFLIVYTDRLAFTEPRTISTIQRGPAVAEPGYSYPENQRPRSPQHQKVGARRVRTE